MEREGFGSLVENSIFRNDRSDPFLPPRRNSSRVFVTARGRDATIGIHLPGKIGLSDPREAAESRSGGGRDGKRDGRAGRPVGRFTTIHTRDNRNVQHVAHVGTFAPIKAAHTLARARARMADNASRIMISETFGRVCAHTGRVPRLFASREMFTPEIAFPRAFTWNGSRA